MKNWQSLGLQAARPQTSPEGATSNAPLDLEELEPGGQKAGPSPSAVVPVYQSRDRAESLVAQMIERKNTTRADLNRLKRIDRHLLHPHTPSGRSHHKTRMAASPTQTPPDAPRHHAQHLAASSCVDDHVADVRRGPRERRPRRMPPIELHSFCIFLHCSKVFAFFCLMFFLFLTFFFIFSFFSQFSILLFFSPLYSFFDRFRYFHFSPQKFSHFSSFFSCLFFLSLFPHF